MREWRQGIGLDDATVMTLELRSCLSFLLPLSVLWLDTPSANKHRPDASMSRPWKKPYVSSSSLTTYGIRCWFYLSSMTILLKVESSLAVTGWLTCAVHDRDSQYNLRNLFRAISHSRTELLLVITSLEPHAHLIFVDIQDALSVLPILIPCADTAAEDILSLVSKCASAKEVVIACQEFMEHLHVLLNDYNNESDIESKPIGFPPALQLKRLISIYAAGESLVDAAVTSSEDNAALTRLTLRRKGPVETLESIFSELDAILLLASQHATTAQSRELAHSLASLFVNAASWSKDKSDTDDVLDQCKV
jgi:hypothetical protein